MAAEKFETEVASSLIGWWRDAGVDVIVGDKPHDWLGAASPVNKVKEAAVAPMTRPAPQTLAALVDHLMNGDIADAGPVAKRVSPAGNPASDLMILTDFPDTADVASGALLGDPVFARMLQAIGHDRDSVYIASLCPGRPVTGRLANDVLDQLAVLARQHIALAAPKRLWLVGCAASRAVLGIDDAAAKGKLHGVNHLGGSMEVIATAHPRMFEGSKSRKAAAWAEMQRLIVRDDA